MFMQSYSNVNVHIQMHRFKEIHTYTLNILFTIQHLNLSYIN